MLHWPLIVAVLIVAVLAVGSGAWQMVAPFAAAQPPEISLAPAASPNYARRTTLRMLLALGVSLVFTFTYRTLAAKSRHAEMVLVPLFDVLQSVSLLGYLSFTARILPIVKYPKRTLWHWQVNLSGAPPPPLHTPRRFQDGSMLVCGSSGQSLAMFPEGSFCRRTGLDDGTGQSLCGCGRVVC